MLKRFLIIIFAIIALIPAGCRTGEYKADLEIYEQMPSVLEQYPDVTKNIARNEDGTLMVTFEKGTMSLWLRTGSDMDRDTREQTTGSAFEIFHGAYMKSEANKKKNGELYRTKIFVIGFVEETELYNIEWDLTQENPNLLKNREGNFY